MNPVRREAYRSWLASELLLAAILGLATVALFRAERLGGYALPEARIALDTAVTVIACVVSILAAVRFLVEGRALDLLLSAGFLVSGVGTFAFTIVGKFGDGGVLSRQEAWAGIGAALVSTVVFAFAPFIDRPVRWRRTSLALGTVLATVALAGCGVLVHVLDVNGPLISADGARTLGAVLAYALQAIAALIAAIGFAYRYGRTGRDLDSWLAIALTLVLFADLHFILTPSPAGSYVLPGDFLRLLSYVVLVVGVWRAISYAEFGRAVAEERARVARDIHDGLAQYLFALSTSVTMLESGSPVAEVLPRLKQAASLAQQEARFAVLALSSASGTAPFDAALRRYVDFLAADGVLDVEMDIDPEVDLAPDEQIEIFRIVQEGLANARRHASARRAWVEIVQRGSRRVVIVRDDGVGFGGDDRAAGQGLKNMRKRAASIGGGFSLRSSPGRGTAIEVVLRAT